MPLLSVINHPPQTHLVNAVPKQQMVLKRLEREHQTGYISSPYARLPCLSPERHAFAVNKYMCVYAHVYTYILFFLKKGQKKVTAAFMH